MQNAGKSTPNLATPFDGQLIVEGTVGGTGGNSGYGSVSVNITGGTPPYSTTCPTLRDDTIIAGLRLNDDSKKLELRNWTLNVSGRIYINESNISSEFGSLIANDFFEIKKSVLAGPIRLKKTGELVMFVMVETHFQLS